jgi:hypothetical protein
MVYRTAFKTWSVGQAHSSVYARQILLSLGMELSSCKHAAFYERNKCFFGTINWFIEIENWQSTVAASSPPASLQPQCAKLVKEPAWHSHIGQQG